MHSLIHIDYAAAAARDRQPERAIARPEARHAPPGRVRGGVARTLATLAVRVDRESVRRAIA